jgi:hypothetical protein
MGAILPAEDVAVALAAERARAALVPRMRRAVLALLASRDVAETVTQEWPAALGLESCALLAERPVSARHWRQLAPGQAALLLAGRAVRVRDGAGLTAVEALHGEAAALLRRDALVRIDVPGGTPALLALGARDAAALPLEDAGARLEFLGQALSAALSRA